MARSKSSKAWLQRHVSDPYVREARAQGYRSRAAFKLLEIARRDRLARAGSVVVDLGAAPGGWSQALAALVGPKGRVVALDLLEMAPIPGVTFIHGDFRDAVVRARIEGLVPRGGVDLVVSDMAPNLSGVGATDQARSLDLCERALEFAVAHLQPSGAFLVKTFQGERYAEFLAAMRAAFAQVASRKPQASRESSSEMYLLGRQPRAGAS